MKKKKQKYDYLSAEIELLIISADDVISTSGGFNWGSGKTDDNNDSDGWT